MIATDLPHWTSGTLVDIPEDECRRLLEARSVGRVAWAGQEGPTVLPVNYAVVGTEVWFRTTAHSAFSREIDDQPVAFQIDDVDDFTRSGWSVLARGIAHVEYDTSRLPRTWPGVDTWPAGAHALYVVIEPRELTGRRVLAS